MMSADGAAKIICSAVKRPGFQPTAMSKSNLLMLRLAADIQRLMMEEMPFCQTLSRNQGTDRHHQGESGGRQKSCGQGWPVNA